MRQWGAPPEPQRRRGCLRGVRPAAGGSAAEKGGAPACPHLPSSPAGSQPAPPPSPGFHCSSLQCPRVWPQVRPRTFSPKAGERQPPPGATPWGRLGAALGGSLKAEHRGVPGQVWREGCMASQPGAQSSPGFRGPSTTGSPRSPQPQATELSTRTAGSAISPGA